MPVLDAASVTLTMYKPEGKDCISICSLSNPSVIITDLVITTRES